MSKPVLILGGGGHAGVLIETLHLLEVEVFGVADAHLETGSFTQSGIQVIGNDEAVLGYKSSDFFLVNGLGPVPKNSRRSVLNKEFIALGYKFLTVVHPSAFVASSSEIGPGAQIMAGAIVQTGSQIGAMSVINTGAIVDHECSVGDYTHIAPGAVLCGGVHTGSSVFVGARAIVTEKLTLGDNSILAAGATLRRHLKAGEIFYGKSE